MKIYPIIRKIQNENLLVYKFMDISFIGRGAQFNVINSPSFQGGRYRLPDYKALPRRKTRLIQQTQKTMPDMATQSLIYK